tara:strand:+ start:201 stop:1082 length:882 start_codon:yes stop_codon:yes gene_type:complete
MLSNKIKEFLRLKINKASSSDLLEELYKISETQADYSFLFQSLLGKSSDEHDYRSLKLLFRVSLKIAKEQEAYDQILEYSRNDSDNIAILSILSIMETIDSVKATSNYFNLKRDIHIFDVPITKEDLSPENIIKYIEDSFQENYEPENQSVSKGSVFFLRKKINKNLDEFVNQILKYFKKAQFNIAKESPYNASSSNLSKLAFWAVRLKSGGSMEPHFHPKGKLSGVIYLDAENKSGNFIIGSSPSATKFYKNEKVIQVKTMRLIIFPSYYFHKTKFNLTSKNRFSMSFDLSV